MKICNKDGMLTAKAKKENGRRFTNWISGTGRNYADDSLKLLTPSGVFVLKLSRRSISENNDIYYITRTNEKPDGSGETVFFALVRYTDRNITEIGFSKAGGAAELIAISKWREMDGGLRFTPGKQAIDGERLLIEVGRALYRMAPDSLLNKAGRADYIKHWTSTFSPAELIGKLRGEDHDDLLRGRNPEDLRCARTCKLIVSLFFMSDNDKSRADHFYRMVVKNMTIEGVEYAELCDKFLSHFPSELQEALRLANEMLKSDTNLPLAVTPAIPPQGTNAPLVATRDLLAEKFLEAEAKARTGQARHAVLKPPAQEMPGQNPREGIVLPPAAAFVGMPGREGAARLVPAQIPSRTDILRMLGRKLTPAVLQIASVAPSSHRCYLGDTPPARPLLQTVPYDRRAQGNTLPKLSRNIQPAPECARATK